MLKSLSSSESSVGILEIKREIGDLNRLRQIVSILITHGFHDHVSKANLLKHATLGAHVKRLTTSKKETTPEHVRETLEALGPTFVKLGQVLSLRPDLVPNAYCEEFKKLQDGVAPLETSVIKKVIEDELKRPVSKLFASFDETPLAAASMGQVHRAKLQNGTSVVIKVQRPGIREIMEHDIDIMSYIAGKIDHSDYSYLHASRIVDEFRKYTERELDFSFEMRNLRKFYDFFKGDATVVIPKIYEEYCTSKVLVMEFIDGIPLKEKERMVKAGFSLKKLAEIDVIATCRQAFELGIFHADAHPGNLMAVRKKGKPALAFLDFGIVGFLDDRFKKFMFEFFMALDDQNTEEITNILLEMGTPGTRCDPKALNQAVAILIMDWKGSNLKEERMSKVIYDIIDEALKHDVNLSPDVILLAKAFVTMEGTGSWLYPELNPIESMQPFMLQYSKEQFSVKKLKREAIADARKMQDAARELPNLAKTLMDRVKDGNFTLHVDATELTEAESIYDLEASRRNITLLAGMLFIGSALLAGVAPDARLAGIRLYVLGFASLIVVGVFYIKTKRKIHNYLDKFRT
jgi:ubiquinone biosynthesis protein